MDKLRRSFRSSFRKKNHFNEDESINRTTWPKDEAAVKTNTCSFEVKYLGCIEVFESRGMQVCEEALKLLKNSKRRPIRGTLHVSGDGLRVVDFETVGLVLDQTIEKVSFCAPDRYYEKGFSYICRDGTTRRWMCHGFLALHDSGERLSHAVGCAFAICLEKKQQREKECSVQFHYNKKDNTFVRFGSFNQGTISDRLKDPQGFKPCNPPPAPKEPVANPHAVARPKASDMYLRQASMRGIGQLPGNSLFKRQYSLRLEQLPSNLLRQQKSPFYSEQPLETKMRAQLNSLPISENQHPPCLPIKEDPSPVEELTDPFCPQDCSSGPISLPAVLTDDIPDSLPPPLLSPLQEFNKVKCKKDHSVAALKERDITSQPPSIINPFSITSAAEDKQSLSSESEYHYLQTEPMEQLDSLTQPSTLPDPSQSVSLDRGTYESLNKKMGTLLLSPDGTNPWDNVPDQPLLRIGHSKALRPASMVETPSFSSAAFPLNPLERGYTSLDNSINHKGFGTTMSSVASPMEMDQCLEVMSAVEKISENKFSELKDMVPNTKRTTRLHDTVPSNIKSGIRSKNVINDKDVLQSNKTELDRVSKSAENQSSGILQDPFDSDWAELALGTKKAVEPLIEKNCIKEDTTIKAFELRM